MRKVILGVAVSLDGFIEGPNGEYDWCPPPSPAEMTNFMSKIDTVFFGRKSFELVGPKPFPGKESFVFSNTLNKIEAKNVHLVSGHVVNVVKEMKARPGKDIWLFGGANLTTTFLNNGLVDEMWLGVVPVVLGGGKPLFQDISQRSWFKVVGSVENQGYVSLTLAFDGFGKKRNAKKQKVT